MTHHPILLGISIILALGAFAFGYLAVSVTPVLIDEKPTPAQLAADQSGARLERWFWMLLTLSVITSTLSFLP